MLASGAATFAVDFMVDVLKGAPVADFCDVSGTYTYTANNSPPINPGDTFTVTFTDCVRDSVDQVVWNGSFIIETSSASGDILSPDYTFVTRVRFQNITNVDAVGTTVISGDSFLSRTATTTEGIVDLAQANLSNPLVRIDNSESTTISSFVVTSHRTGSGFTIGNSGDTLNLTYSGLVESALNMTVTSPISGTDLDTPNSGILTVTAEDNSTIILNVSDGGNVRIDLDTNGDGTIDTGLTTSWSALN
jgi:hypothetical protein